MTPARDASAKGRQRGATLLFLALLACCLPASCRPERNARALANPACSVEAGFGGVVSENCSLFPVTVAIRNSLAATRGTIRITQPARGFGKTEVCYRLDFDSPSPSQKRFVIPVRIEPSRELSIRVDFESHFLPFQQRISAPRTTKPLVLCVEVPRDLVLPDPTEMGETIKFEGRTIRTTDFLQPDHVSWKYKFLAIAREALPVEPLGLDGVHAVVLSGRAFECLAASQILALRAWVATGGTLVMIAPTHGDNFHDRFTSLAGDLDLRVASPGAARFGAGIIATSGIDQPLLPAPWDLSDSLRKLLFPAAAKGSGEQASQKGYFSVDQRERLLSMAKPRRLPVVLFVFVAAAYVYSVGPLSRRLTRSSKRRSVKWVLPAAAVGLFSVLAYVCAAGSAGKASAIEVSIVDISTEAGIARGNAMVWVYSASVGAHYSVSLAGADSHLSARESSLGAGAAAGVEVARRDGAFLDASIPIFSDKMFDGTWFMPWPGAAKIELRSETGRPEATVPPGLKVRSAYLGLAEGIIPLAPNDNGGWTAAGNGPEGMVPVDIFASDSLYHGFNDDSIEADLIRLTFPRGIAVNPRETSFDMRRLLTDETGVLLLFVEPEAVSPRPVVGGVLENLERVTLIRIPVHRPAGMKIAQPPRQAEEPAEG